jgi:hypothetical protein
LSRGERIILDSFDSDEDMTERDVMINELFWCSDPSGEKYAKAKVVRKLGSMFEVTFDEYPSKKNNKWVDLEHEHLASYQ